MKYTLLLIVSLLLCCCEQVALVQDDAALLSDAQRQRLETFQTLLLEEQDVELHLVILERAAVDLDQEALELFEQKRIGGQTSGARGLLLVVDPISEQARIEVGYDLEGVFPDGFIASLEYDQMLPFFQSDRVGHGVEALTELLVARLQGASAETSAAAGKHLSGGAGARIATSGEVEQPQAAQPDRYLPQADPLATLDAYRQSLRDRSKDPELEIYTEETRAFFRQWLVTDAQQQNALRELDKVWSLADVRVKDAMAVIRYPVKERQASPYFLRQSEFGWQLDFATMTKTVGFNHRNQWHFRSREHPYMFAFADWRFDKNGFPHAR
ncbi:uncharacterized protein SAMN02745165_01641 [Malonomonas rubra DSM 5091]|uniref:TPM domain-containing protein n=1 Tax=Malonomonas rubra DSM 5091 TaxID=1122189 RepID=A0A1M6GRB6_MALRU|nr:TPM domain-containing protein [Malonomonas rubra]SHJ12406.1 uncharacterized protein SAMN02745165_01641 [Malonomonas rubra DSM 5091]